MKNETNSKVKDFLIDNSIQKNPNESLYNVFKSRGLMHGQVLYLSLYGKLPSNLYVDKIDCNKLEKELQIAFPKSKADKIVNRNYDHKKKTEEVVGLLFPIEGKILIQYEQFSNVVELLYCNDTTQEIFDEVKSIVIKCTKPEYTKGTISLLASGDNFDESFRLSSFEIPEPNLDISRHYNDDLAPVHETILQKLNGEKGLVLLHGIPGTGKTTYIRYLVNKIGMNVIYIPQDMTEQIGKPDFVKFISKHPGSLFIIEDAESLLTDRAFNNNNAIANLLNLSDGILGDCLKIQIICTFNIKLSRIDKALLRKGRIIARYEFDKLSANKSNDLLRSLGKNIETTDAMTLAEIYNNDETDFESSKDMEQIGFVNS